MNVSSEGTQYQLGEISGFGDVVIVLPFANPNAEFW